MLTQEQNEMLTRVGAGTPMGELLRRYWHPVAIVRDLSDDAPVKLVRILGENLVLFRDKKNRVGLIGDRCCHRGASLSYGRVEERGISCAYHGWLYDVEGNVLETPPEPAESKFRLTVKQMAYPVKKMGGLYWTYMGPAPVPAIPKYDVWARRDGRHWIRVQPRLDCNWFQAMENSVDTAHLHILHQEMITRGLKVRNTTRGTIDDLEKYEFYSVPYGIMKKRVFTDGVVEEHPLIFPNLLRQANRTQIRVPIDDTHTWICYLHFVPSEDGSEVEEVDEDIPVEYKPAVKIPPDALHPVARYTMKDVDAQDFMAWETQGSIADRTHERLAASDRGVIMLRELMMAELEKVRQGLDPINVYRDPNHPIIDTRLDESFKAHKAGTAPIHLPKKGFAA